MKKILVITGELSGFNYAKRLIPCLSKHLKVYGVLLDEVQNCKRIFDSNRLIAFGLFEAITKLPAIWMGKKTVERFLEEEKPDAVLLVDFPGFNLKIAEIAKRKGIKVLYFISPKFWAWGERRVERIKRVVDRMFVIFPFEVEIYKKHGVNVTYVGNPLKDIVKPTLSCSEFKKRYGLKGTVFALMPGSRHSEIKYLLKPMVEASKRFNGNFLLPVASSVDREYVESVVNRVNSDVVLIPEGERYNLLFSADAGIIASGTASLEAAIANLPHVVVYKLNPLTFAIAKRVVKIPYVSLPNIIAGRNVVPELLQQKVNPDEIVATLSKVHRNRDFMRKLLRERVSSKLSGGAVENLCLEILREV